MKPSDIKSAISNIAADIARARQQSTQAKSSLIGENNRLANMPTTYAEAIVAIDAGAAAHPDDPAWLGWQAEKDLFVAEFLELQPVVQAAAAAMPSEF